MPAESHTAFPKTELRLKELIRSLDPEEFKKPCLAPCASLFDQCHGICCSLPVAVTREEEATLKQLVKKHAALLREMGIRIRKTLTMVDRRSGKQRLSKKWRRFRDLKKIIQSVLDHEGWASLNFGELKKFLKTCVFATRDGACALQILSKRLGRHKWYYKPINCWKFPLGIREGRLVLAERSTDADRHFLCLGEGEKPAYETATEELTFLSRILERDLMGEIKRDGSL